MTKIELVKNADGLVTQITQDGTTYTLSYPEKEEYLAITKLKQWIKMSDGSYVAFKQAGGAAGTTPTIPANATFAEVLTQAEDSKQLFITNYVRDKIDANLLEHIGNSNNRGTYYNSGTNWRDLLPIINSYLSEDLEQDLFNYLMGKVGENIVLKVVFGDNRNPQKNRISGIHTISELDKEYVFQYEKWNEQWNYDLTIEIRSSDNKAKFSISHGTKTGNRNKHGTGYGAIRGIWFEEIT